MMSFPIAPPVFDGKCRKISVENTMDWLRQGWGFFSDYPGFWILATAFCLTATGILCLIPWVGKIIAMFLTPLLAAGLLHACQKISDGKQPDFTDLFAGFTYRTGQLIILGLFNVIALTLIVMIVMIVGLIVMGVFGKVFNTDSSVEVILAIMTITLIVPFITLLLFSPVLMAIWFAPALVFFNSVPPLAALKASFSACFKNFWPFLFYGLIVSLFLFLAMLTAGIGLLLLVPVISGSIYASYHDIFLAN